jgi:hypothetical protein
MSAGTFDIVQYELDSSNGSYIMAARVQPETLAATDGTTPNSAPAGAINAPGTAKASKGKKEFGVGMRYVNLELVGAAPTDYSGQNIRIPVLTPATFAAWTKNTEITYLDTTWKVIGRIPESVV